MESTQKTFFAAQNQLIEKGVLRSFAMGSTMGKHELAICFAEEYKNLTDKIMTGPLFCKSAFL